MATDLSYGIFCQLGKCIVFTTWPTFRMTTRTIPVTGSTSFRHHSHFLGDAVLFYHVRTTHVMLITAWPALWVKP